MSQLSGWVLAAAAVLTGPALWAALVNGTMPLDVALTRFLLATGGCWLAASLVAGVWEPDREPAQVRADEPEPAQREG
jgi:hypothetical protein